jgi:hypothetical protein
MKKVVIIPSLLIIMLSLQAQKKQAPPVEFGIKAGLNISNAHVQNSNNPDSKASFYAGGLAHIHITQQFAVQPEIMYSGQGYAQTLIGMDYKTRLGYINIPVLAQLMFGEGFRLETGPQLGLLAGAHRKVNKTSDDVKDQFKGLDFAWVFGVGYLTPAGFGVDARYNLGISNINDVSSVNVNNRVFAVGVFYQFKNL